MVNDEALTPAEAKLAWDQGVDEMLEDLEAKLLADPALLAKFNEAFDKAGL